MIDLTKLCRAIFLTLIASTLTYCTADTDLDTEDSEEELTEDQSSSTANVVAWMDTALDTYYLYNEEYKTLDLDYTLEYDEFLYYTLMGMSTNVLDKKYDKDYGIYNIYSFITREESATRASSSDQMSVGYGFVRVELVLYKDDYAYAVLGVYNDSPASELGIARGDVITHINGEHISSSNYYDFYYNLLLPNANDEISVTLGSNESYALTAQSHLVNPVLHSEILNPNIGYIVYSQFNANFDDELEEALDEFIAAGTTELILDLRINSGGYNSSARLLGSIITGSYGTDQIFSYYIFNDELTDNSSSTAKISGYTYDSSNRAFYEKYQTTQSKFTTLSAPRIYCLVSNYTASASEMVINSLRGTGFEVILIGETTNGKNVGMFLHEASYDGYDYDFYPITFESRNSQMEGGYEDGMEVDYEVNDFNGFSDFNSNDPLVAKALELITGESSNSPTRATSSLELTKLSEEMPQLDVVGTYIKVQE